jgi:RNA polymerase sigma factor (sigma-70 family)
MNGLSAIPSDVELALLNRVLRDVVRARRLSAEDADDFTQSVHLRLIERKYDIFAQFAGRSSLRTYLTVVVTRMLLDWRSTTRGRWRPAAAASRLGPHAVALDRLMHRDGYTTDQAVEIARREAGAPGVMELRSLADTLPCRTPRRIVPLESVDESSCAARFEDPVEVEEARGCRRVQQRALARAFRQLPSEDQRLLKLRYLEQRPVRDVAVMLGAQPKELYRRFERAIRSLRRLTLAALPVAILLVAPSPARAQVPFETFRLAAEQMRGEAERLRQQKTIAETTLRQANERTERAHLDAVRQASPDAQASIAAASIEIVQARAAIDKATTVAADQTKTLTENLDRFHAVNTAAARRYDATLTVSVLAAIAMSMAAAVAGLTGRRRLAGVASLATVALLAVPRMLTVHHRATYYRVLSEQSYALLLETRRTRHETPETYDDQVRRFRVLVVYGAERYPRTANVAETTTELERALGAQPPEPGEP